MSLEPDFCNRTYTVEVLRTERLKKVVEVISGLLQSQSQDEEIGEHGEHVRLVHGLIASGRPYHFAPGRELAGPDKKRITAPRTKVVRGKKQFLYDIVVAYADPYVLVAVPFHGLAEDVFVRIDRAIGATKTVYHRVDIGTLVIRLGAQGITTISGGARGAPKFELGLTRCQLSYSDPKERRRGLQQVRMVGANLGESDVYRELIGPVLKRRAGDMLVSPTLLGFALYRNGVKRCSATTDRHGNFKLWIGPRVVRMTRIFEVLTALEGMEDVAHGTSNLPILQSRVIRAEDEE